MPGSVCVGIPEKKASKAARPPADAPMPTMGKPFSLAVSDPVIGLVEEAVAVCVSVSLRRFFFCLVMAGAAFVSIMVVQLGR